ncbi:MAG: asparagine synthase (glutamine-hydrolyzing) [Candidatus Tectomicrobia bacterium]|uniref:asparagine synthase (glutamine-hydrolyzing) n=1 Tax=Tectimicrobiota bacterium TaxID=2528274 RepID=A0A932MKG3_UNCTE|nr:asparagine synthase (glutamine-hydrolyzing) [Candidatus Tectomicrobia bacterium]
MCGIAGIITEKLSPWARREAVERMCAAMVHRGPDDAGVEEFSSACLGMRRLNIIDTSARGRQPMPNEDKSVWVVLNGEIYNFQFLRSELEGRGHVFRSGADTEVILHLYEEMGEGLCRHLRGMFGFAVWDGPCRRMLFARDRLGIKPFYYAEVPGGWVFASEVGALTASGLVGTEPDYAALDHYLSFGYVPPPRTALRGVHVLPPGHLARIRNGRFSVEQWWDFPEAGEGPDPADDTPARLRSVLEESVRLHRISDVPLGAFLSGGIDSTALVGLMARMTERPVRTFSVGFSDAPEGFDERSYAREAAAAFGAEHTEVVMNGAVVREELPRIIRHLDQPSFDGVNTYLVSRAAREGGVTVALSGLGGDEVFGGYDTYQMIPRWASAARMWGRIPLALRRALGRALGGGVANGVSATSARARKLGRLPWVDSPLGLYALARLTLWPAEKAALYGEDGRSPLAEASGADSVLDLLPALARGGGRPWTMVSRLEMQIYMCWRLLRDTDAMSMAHSLEVRVPLIDHEVVEFVCSLPAGWERRWGHPKRLLTEALSDLLPPRIVSRTKQGFAFPMEKWMKAELREVVEDALSVQSVRRRGFFSPLKVRALYEGFLRGEYEYPVIWQFVVLELWLRDMESRRAEPFRGTVSPAGRENHL